MDVALSCRICYVLAMESSPKRLTESLGGKLAAFLLSILWIASMGMTDGTAYSSFPVSAGMVLVALCLLACIVRGNKLLKMRWLGWFSLAAGGYFLVRSGLSYSRVEAGREMVLVLWCAVYYMAGVHVARAADWKWLLRLVGVAALLNILFFFLMQQPWAPIEWTGRPAEGLSYTNSRPVGLLVYKNCASALFVVLGMLLVLSACWQKERTRLSRGLGVVVGVAALVLAFFCRSRVPFLLVPLSLFIGWGLHMVLRSYEGKRLSAFSYVLMACMLVALGCAVWGWLFGGLTRFFVEDVDSHLRYHIWKFICRQLPDAGLIGFGTGASQWEIVPYFDEWATPNYAHNEYLQAWMDYGLVGVGLVVTILLAHVIAAWGTLSAEPAGAENRRRSGLALLVLACMAAYACTDFPWHSFPLAGMTAFACGVLASPYAHERGNLFSFKNWAPSASGNVVRIQAQGLCGRIVLALLCLSTVFLAYRGAMKHYLPWWQQWELNRLISVGGEENIRKARQILRDVAELYSCATLPNRYMCLPHMNEKLFPEQQKMLELAVQANPRQFFALATLANLYSINGKYAEADELLRRSYPGDGMKDSCLFDWSTVYALNLLDWATHCMQKGEHSKALSLIDYAMNMHQYCRVEYTIAFRYVGGLSEYQRSLNKGLQELRIARVLDARLLRNLGIRPDHSWQKPYSPGGKPALYQRWAGENAPKKPGRFIL